MFQALTRVVDIYIYTFGFNLPSLQRLDHSKRVTLYLLISGSDHVHKPSLQPQPSGAIREN